MTVGRARLEQSTLTVLLFAGALVPVAGQVLEPATHASPLVIGAAIVAAVFAIIVARLSRRGAASRVGVVILVLLASLASAAILRGQSNVFYTSTALFGGMVVLLALHVAGIALRHVIERDAERAPPSAAPSPIPAAMVISGLEHLPPNEVRAMLVGQTEPAPCDVPASSPRSPDIATITFADGIASWSAWLLVGFWLLVARGHRHVATAVLLLLGALLALRLVAMLPEALSPPLAGAGRPRRAR